MTEELKEMESKIVQARHNEDLIEKYKKEAEANQSAQQVAKKQSSKATF